MTGSKFIINNKKILFVLVNKKYPELSKTMSSENMVKKRFK